MTHEDATDPADFLHTLIAPAAIRRLARETGFLQRQGKLDVVDFLVCTAFVLQGRLGQRVASMRRTLVLRTRKSLARSSFYERFSPAFVVFVEAVLQHLQQRAIASPPKLRGLLDQFRDVIAADATVIKVHDELADRWPGCRKSRKAAIKVHTWIRAVTGELLWHRITGERKADSKAFGVTHDARGKLFLFDRGYPSASMWWRIHRLGGFFLTRVPASYCLWVSSENRRHRGRARRLVNTDLRESIEGLQRDIIDVNCLFRVHVRGYRGKRGRYEHPSFRVVGLWNDKRRDYDFYVTNLSPEQMPAEAMRNLYRLRWEVELHYRLGKGGLGLDDLHSSKADVVLAMVNAALLRASVSMQARRVAQKHLRAGLWVNPEAWGRIWQQLLGQLLPTVLQGPQAESGWTWSLLAELAADPNRRRPPNRHLWEIGSPRVLRA